MPLRYPDFPQPNEDFFVDPNYDELQALEQQQFVPGQYRRNPLEVFAGLEGQDFRRPQSFGEGFLQGLSGSVGSLGTAASQKRAQFEESEARRKAAFDANRIKRSQELRDMSGKERRDWIEARRREGVSKKKAEDEFKRDNPPATKELLDAKPWLRRQGIKEGDPVPIKEHLEAPPKPEKTLAEIEAEAEAKARGARRGAPPIGAAGGAEKPPNRYQIESGNFANRALNADTNAQALEDKGVRVSRLTATLPFGLADPLEGLQSDKDRQYWQAVRQFTEAHLRRESGATITPAELQMVAKTYFAQPNDSKTLIAQKRASRQEIISGLNRAANSGRAKTGAQNKDERAGVRQSAIGDLERGDVDGAMFYLDANPWLDDDEEFNAALDKAGVPR